MIVELLVQHCSLGLTRNTLSGSNPAVRACVRACMCVFACVGAVTAVSVCSTIVYVLIRLAARGTRASGQNPHRMRETQKQTLGVYRSAWVANEDMLFSTHLKTKKNKTFFSTARPFRNKTQQAATPKLSANQNFSEEFTPQYYKHSIHTVRTSDTNSCTAMQKSKLGLNIKHKWLFPFGSALMQTHGQTIKQTNEIKRATSISCPGCHDQSLLQLCPFSR